MRWFWLFILALVLLTAGLYVKRVRTNTVITPAVPHGTAERQARPSRRTSTQPRTQAPVEPKAQRIGQTEPESDPKPAAVQTTPGEPADEPIITASQEHDPDPDPDLDPESESDSEPDAVLIVEPAQDAQLVSDPDVQTPEPIVDPVALEQEEEQVQQQVQRVEEPEILAEPMPTYELLPDGSFTVLASGVHISGSGGVEDPFVLDWVTLRSVDRLYEPKKGKHELPDWLNVLDGAYVSITGNTLVPVIATTTREVLVMQNPWDGCCIGIPPSPYDAIEVSLNHDVDFGSSAVGYGTVQGVFVLDPYVVEGWVLGLYIIEDATYRSGEGMAFPDF